MCPIILLGLQIKQDFEGTCPKHVQNLAIFKTKTVNSKSSIKATVQITTKIIINIYQMGEFILMEGTSGTGKDTQAKLLADRIVEGNGNSYCPPVTIFHDSDPFMKRYRNNYENYASLLGEDRKIGLLSMVSAILTNRELATKEVILPNLRIGSTIVSNRGILSTLVYQYRDNYPELSEKIIDSHDEFGYPNPNGILLYSADSDMAMQRITRRGEQLGVNENPEKLKEHSKRFLKMADFYLNYKANQGVNIPLEIIDAGLSIDEVSERTWRAFRNWTN